MPSQKSSVTSAMAEKPPMPAFTHNTSIPPNSAAMRVMAALLSPGLPMSARIASMPVAAAAASVAWLRPVIATRAPSLTKACAAARPIPLFPPNTAAVFPANLTALEHPVGIGGLLGNRLHHVPVLHHLAALDPQDIDHGDAAIAGSKPAMRMHGDEVSVRDDPRNVIVNVRMLRKEGLEEVDRCLAAGRRHGVVLDVARIDPGFEGLAHLLIDIELGHEAGDDLFGLQAALGRPGVRRRERQ